MKIRRKSAHLHEKNDFAQMDLCFLCEKNEWMDGDSFVERHVVMLGVT